MSFSTYERVKKIVCEALIADPGSVSEDSNLMLDLNAESIDFLDIVFRLEEEFAIQIPRGEIESKARVGLKAEEFEVNGVLQPKGLQRLKELMPEVSPNYFKTGLRVADIPKLFTIKTLIRMVEKQLKSSNNVRVQQAPPLTV